MKHSLKRLTALLLALLLCLSLCACGGKDTPASPSESSSGGSSSGTPAASSAPTEKELEKKLKGVSKVKLDHVYTMSYLDFTTPENSWIQNLSTANGIIYIAISYSRQRANENGGTDWEDGIQFWSLPADGSGEATLLFEKPNTSEYNEQESWNRYSYIGNVTVAPDGTFWYVEQTGFSDWSDEENYIYSNENDVVHIDTQGNELDRIDTNSFLRGEDDWFYVNQFLFLKDGGILLIGDSFIILNADLSMRCRAQIDTDRGWLNSVVQTGSGAIIGWMYSYSEAGSGYKLIEVNPADGSYREIGDLPFQYSSYFLSGEGDTIILSSGNSVYSYNYRSGTTSELVNWLNSDINSNRIGSLYSLNDGSFLVQEYDRSWSRTRLGILRPNADVVEKYVIRFAANYLDDTMADSIIDFNKQNDIYRISYDDYSRYSTNEDSNGGITKLNQDIVSGNIPDMFLMDGLPYDAYAGKGLLLDLSDRIASAYNTEDFVSNVFDALRYNGKIYSLVPSFNVVTCVGKRSIVGDTPGWTMEDLQAILQQNPGAVLFEGMERGQILSALLSNTMDSYIDRETGRCSFNSASFVGLLELIRTFPETIDWNSYYGDDYDYTLYESQYREGRTLLKQQYISNYDNIKYLVNQYGGDVTFIGYPCAEGVGSAFQPQLEVAISSRTKLDDACWDFIKYLLSEEYQSSLTYGLPVRISCLKAMEEKAMTAQNNGYYYDYDYPVVYNTDAANAAVAEAISDDGGETVTPGDLTPPETASPTDPAFDEDMVTKEVPFSDEKPEVEIVAADEPIEIIEEPAVPYYYDDYWSKPCTQEMIDTVNAAIYSCRSVSRDRSDVQAIIEEEAGAFFSGQKSAQQVADIIQSRVSLYVAESM